MKEKEISNWDQIPMHILRQVENYLCDSRISLPNGNRFIKFVANYDVLSRYYSHISSKETLSWIDPRYNFFGSFYQRGDKSKNGYISTRTQSQDERTREEVDGIMHLLNLSEGSSIMDCPCGVGRHSIALAERGYRMLSVDLNYNQLIVGYENALLNEKITSFGDNRIFFTLDDMKNMGTYPKQHNCFEAVINMFYSFGFFEKEEDNLEVLKNFYRLLKPGGKFLMHTDVNMERILQKTYAFKEKRILEDGSKLCIEDIYDPATKRINGSWVIDDIKKDYSVRVYTNDEWISLCKQVGFKTVSIYSDWQGNQDDDSEILIFLAYK